MPQVLVERDGPVMVVTLNRPKRMNAMTMTMFSLLDKVWHEASEDDEVRCCVLTANGLAVRITHDSAPRALPG